MRKILYYISDHGMGHTTRSIAIIRYLQKYDYEIIIRNSNMVNLLKKSLPNYKILSGITDVGPIINDDGISINSEKTTEKVGMWLDNLSENARIESEQMSSLNPDLIISDISAMPFLVAKKLKINSIAISNFSWYDTLDSISSEQSNFLKKAYDCADLAIQLSMGTDMNHFKQKTKVGCVSRNTTNTKRNILNQLNIDPLKNCIFVSLGNLKKELSINIDKNIMVFSPNKLKIPKTHFFNSNTWIESQDLVHASDLVICKCGHGIISECLTTGTPFLYVADDNHIEQKSMIDYLSKHNLGHRIHLNELSKLNLDSKLIDSQPISVKNNDVKSLVNKILEFLNGKKEN